MSIHNQFVSGPDGSLSPAGLRILGPVMPIEVHVPPAIAEVLTNQSQPIPSPATGMAVIDTGASLTCVHEPILAQLNLNPISVAMMGTAGGQV